MGEVHGGFLRLLAARPGERLAALCAGRRPPRPHPYDSHPPTAERIALLEELSADEWADEAADAPTAFTLLFDPDRVFAALEARTLPHEATQQRRMSWDDLVTARAVLDAEGWSRPLRLAVARALRSEAQGAGATVRARRGTPEEKEDAKLPGLEEVLDAFDRGLLWMAVADRIPKPPQATRLVGPSARNFIRPRVFDGLAGMVRLRLSEAGHAAPDIAWSGVPGLALPEEWEKSMDDALDAAVADTPDTGPCAFCSPAATAYPHSRRSPLRSPPHPGRRGQRRW
ncbi:hypothetical protein [Streptomyces sp. NBC_01235]|uniref:hypothetical protein n=1 Tax=Streptomyces sp. NBC_01235 TaxID=2903788 RepID=UPI002E0E4951|nr:hypothetical protein OG289_48780 [Streptomyces sp. NBC_01235]